MKINKKIKCYMIKDKENNCVRTKFGRNIWFNIGPIKVSISNNKRLYNGCGNEKYKNCEIIEYELKETGKIIDMNELLNEEAKNE